MELTMGGVVVVTDDAPQGASQVRDVVDIGIDTGNGRTHLTGDRMEGGVVEYTMPSAISLFAPTSTQILAMREAGPGEWGKFSAEEHMVVFDKALTETVVGELALLVGIDQRYPVTTGSGDNERYIDLGLKLALVAMARAYAPATEIKARVCTGLPVALWSTARADAVANAWKGRHSITYRGTPVTIHIVDVVVKAEGHAAWVTLDSDKKIGTSLIIDVGARTAIATLLYDGVVNKTVQAELGVDQVLDQLSGHLSAKGMRALNLYERYALLDALVAKRPYSIVANGKQARVDETAAALFAAAGEQLVAYLATQFPFNQINNASISGGGVLFLGDAAADAYTARSGGATLERLADAEKRTARGYYEQLSLRPAKTSKRTGKGRK